MTKQSYIFLFGTIFVLFATSINNLLANPWNEEATDSLGNIGTVHSNREVHSSLHYDIVKLLLYKSGIPLDSAETIARYSALVDQINPKANYPYPTSLNNVSLADTFPSWNESIAGTERGGLHFNLMHELSAQYWHFAYRDPNDTISGPMVYGDYPVVYNSDFRSPPYFWRIPLSYNLSSIQNWALYGTGAAGMPDPLCPDTVFYFNNTSQSYEPIPPQSLAAFGMYLHSLADSYSHEHCMVFDTLRSHPDWSDECGLSYHSHYEFSYDTAIYAMVHADACIQAMWHVIQIYKSIHGISTPNLWVDDNNGYEDGDGIPDALEDNYNGIPMENFMEKWKSPSSVDFNNDGQINHFDHTAWRIWLCNSETQTLNLKIFCEGPFIGTTMTSILNQKAYIPLAQPFNSSPWNFSGLGAVAMIPNDTITDWVLVELRDAASPAAAGQSTIISRQTGFLLSNGNIVSRNATTPLSFNAPYIQNLYVVVRHRNHIAVMSNYPLTKTGNIFTYDFTNSSDKYFGNANGFVQLSPTAWGMCAGDGNASGQIDLDDLFNSWYDDAGESGYLKDDYDLNGNADNNDKNNWLIPNFGCVSNVPN
ncbi:MAG: hypothetical protein GXO89_10750 [Chlorobi bacterium]|nr:hypothetical protein [Chlorobiota bacterium]